MKLLRIQDNASVFSLRNTIGIPREFFEALAIPDRDKAPFRLDQLLAFEQVECVRDAGAPDPKHQSEKVMGEGQLRVQAVMGHEQPACQTLFYAVSAVRKSGARNLDHEDVDVLQQKAREFRISLLHPFQVGGAKP